MVTNLSLNDELKYYDNDGTERKLIYWPPIWSQYTLFRAYVMLGLREECLQFSGRFYVVSLSCGMGPIVCKSNVCYTGYFMPAVRESSNSYGPNPRGNEFQ